MGAMAVPIPAGAEAGVVAITTRYHLMWAAMAKVVTVDLVKFLYGFQTQIQLLRVHRVQLIPIAVVIMFTNLIPQVP
jgi:hypothetical protein